MTTHPVLDAAPLFDPPVSPAEGAALVLFLEERRRAHRKHGDTSMESCGKFADRRIRVLVEEVGEVARVLNDYENLDYDSASARLHLREELIQVGAMALAWIAAVEDEPLTGDEDRRRSA